jgi:hypothetical protein
MAYNILSMKYPRSGAGIDSAKWIASIDPADVKLTPAGEKIVEKQKLGVKAVDNAIGELKDLDRQIADLCVKRELAHFDVINLSTAAVAPITKSYSDANNIYKEFLKRGFASDKVKSAVFWIRKMLFDDSQDVYREILCAEIKLAESSDMRLEFIFEHAPSCRCFSIGIPVKKPKPREIAGKWRIGYEIEENYPRRYGGDALCTNIAGIDLVQPYNNGSTETVAYHYDVRVFKKQFDDYVRNGFKTLAENKDGQWRWIGYDSFDSAMGEPPMSAHDYLNEST